MKGLVRNILIILALSFFLISCEKEDASLIKSVEGHWVYTTTKAEIIVTDPALKEKIQTYIDSQDKELKISYEFNNDKTFHFYQSYKEPLKGIYKMTSKDTFVLDDSRGLRSVIKEDSLIYIIADLKEEIIKELKIDQDKVIKIQVVDTFERGLSTE